MHPISGRALTVLLVIAAAPIAVRSQSIVNVDLRAAPGTVEVAPGVPVNAWLFGGTLPGPVIRLREDQTLRLRFHNDLPEPTTIHWHGQPVRLGMDGVPEVSRPATATGQEFLYELDGLHPGTYWYHPHGVPSQLDMGLMGLLIVDPIDPHADPAYDLEQVVVLDDWFDPLGGAFSGHLLGGRSSAGQAPIVVQTGQRLRLRILNAAALTNYVIALDGHPMTVTHADGNRVQPVSVQALPIGMGERYDVLIDCQNPGVWSLAVASLRNRNTTLVRGIVQYAGQTQTPPSAAYVPANLSSGTLLDYAQLAAFHPVMPITPTPDRSYTLALATTSGSSGMIHTINGESWPNVTPVLVADGEQVQITMTNLSAMMAGYHPMHLHGHFFRLLGTAGGVTHPPVKDTILIRPNGQPWSSAVAQVAMDNPGRWLLHCHDMNHMASGMMTVVDYVGDTDADGIGDASDREPTQATPVTMIAASANAFVPGATDQITVQWTPGELVSLFAGFGELATPVMMLPYGRIELDPAGALFMGSSTADANAQAGFAYSIPPSPALVGLRLVFQSAATTPLPGGVRFGTAQALTIR